MTHARSLMMLACSATIVVACRADPGAVTIAPALVPGGTFVLGDWKAKVQSVYLDRYEVSVQDYRACVRAGACSVPVWSMDRERTKYCNYYHLPARFPRRSSRGPHPVDCVTFRQAMDYCSWVGGRLPSLEEWAWEATGRGEMRAFPWGNTVPGCDRAATVSDERTRHSAHMSKLCHRWGTVPVDSLPESASRDGVLNMLANVSEWVLTKNGAARSVGWGFLEWEAFTPGHFEWVRKGSGPEVSDAWWGNGFRCAYEIPPPDPSR
jgi:formylglycine-generating enzyme required for sulfatase activity